MKTLKLSIILATSLLTGYTYAAPSNSNELYGIDTAESNYMEGYAFDTQISTSERINFSAPASTQIKSNELYDPNAVESNYREAYAFDTEASMLSERVNFSAPTTTKRENAEIWNNFLANDEFDF